MPAEIDLSKGTRGKFAKPGTVLKLPVYLAADVQAYLTARGIDVDQLVNDPAQKGHRAYRGGELACYGNCAMENRGKSGTRDEFDLYASHHAP